MSPTVERANKVLMERHSSSRSPFRALLYGSLIANLLLVAAIAVVATVWAHPSSSSSCASSSLLPRVHSIPMNKSNRIHPWHNNSESVLVGLTEHSPPPPFSRRHLTTSSGSLEGAAYADYSVRVTVAGQTLEVIVDTGSSTLAVAASASDNCATYYTGSCDGQTVGDSYDSGSWSGHACSGAHVSFEGLSAGQPAFGGIQTQHAFLTDCASSSGIPISEGIVGMAYSTLISSGSPFTPLFDSVRTQNPDIPDVFSMQCCGWDGTTAGTGTLVLGGTDSSLYTGSWQYTPITAETYYCVSLTGVTTSSGDSSSSSSTTTTTSSRPRFFSYDYDNILASGTLGASDCTAVIDSGTSAIALDTQYATVISALQGSGNVCSTAERDAFPDLVLHFDGATLSVPPSKYYQPLGNGCYRLFVTATSTGSIIGQAMMEQYYTVFDRANSRVGFATISGC